MALPACLSKLVLMRIFVTACAVRELNAPELLEFFSFNHPYTMTFLTIDAFMFPGKREPCSIVGKPCCGDERILIMAICAFR
jgi:hypothetical protein